MTEHQLPEASKNKKPLLIKGIFILLVLALLALGVEAIYFWQLKQSRLKTSQDLEPTPTSVKSKIIDLPEKGPLYKGVEQNDGSLMTNIVGQVELVASESGLIVVEKDDQKQEILVNKETLFIVFEPGDTESGNRLTKVGPEIFELNLVGGAINVDKFVEKDGQVVAEHVLIFSER
ncbi:hypothetical protein ACFL0Y_03600 [Patescibacteria group bacterium]